MTANGVWDQPKLGGDSPGQRVGHSLDLVKGSFGGATGVLLWGKGASSYHTDALALSLKDNKWTKPKLHGRFVVSRWRHASHGLSARRAVFITGGSDFQGQPVMDPQLLDISTGSRGPV